MRLLPAAPVLAAALLLAAPALASETRTTTFYTGKDHGPGQARAAGTIVFKNANQMTLDLRVNDICPGDDRYAQLVIGYADKYGVPYAEDLVEDRRGCAEKDGVPYHYDVQNAPIDQIVLTLTERDASGVAKDTARRVFDNPYR